MPALWVRLLCLPVEGHDDTERFIVYVRDMEQPQVEPRQSLPLVESDARDELRRLGLGDADIEQQVYNARVFKARGPDDDWWSLPFGTR